MMTIFCAMFRLNFTFFIKIIELSIKITVTTKLTKSKKVTFIVPINPYRFNRKRFKFYGYDV